VFNPGASAFTITATPPLTLTISGTGITNNSGIAQNLVAATVGAANFATIAFTNSATAGSGTFFTTNASTMFDGIGGQIMFFNASTAANGTFTNNGDNGTSGTTTFYDASTAGNGTFTNNRGGGVVFYGSSTAGNGTFTNNGAVAAVENPGFTDFYDTSSADNATLIANGGQNGVVGGSIYFVIGSSGGTARVLLSGNSNLDISRHLGPGVTVGSIKGSGNIFLGHRTLMVGNNNLSTLFSGVIQDGGISGGTGGSLTKVGTGKLILSHANIYTGGTTLRRGKLMINNTSGSGTGSGPVQVNGGWLGGQGTIAGAVTVGAGTGRGAVLSPGYLNGVDSPGALTIQSPLSFTSDATYEVEVNSSSATADEVIANGVTINTGAQFSFADLGSGTLIPGTVFTVINNTAATPIAGTFSNLLNGSMFTANGNTYQVNYDGGDGNDLTLAVIP